jgi:phospholipase/lecithinase/hemolysin
MTMLRRLVQFLALLACVPLLAQAAGEPSRASALPAAYSKIVVFGDGLSDGGFFGRLTGNRYPPSPPFHEGRWTNGPTWVEVLAAQSGWPLDPKDNHAQGGATTGHFNINAPLKAALGVPADVAIVGVLAQIERTVAMSGSIDPRALHVVWAGGHDIGAYLDYGQPDLRAQPPAQNIRAGLERLRAAGARHVLLGTLPDLGATPAYAGTPKAAEASRLTREYNEGLARAAAELRAAGLQVTLLDGAAAFARAGKQAQALGIRHFDRAYLSDDYIDFAQPLAPAKPLPAGRDPGEYFSFWAVAASAKVHRVIAQSALEALVAARPDMRWVRAVELPSAAFHPLHEGPGRVAFLSTSPVGVPHVARIELKRGDVQAPYASDDGKARLATVLNGTLAFGEGTAVERRRERSYRPGESFVIPPAVPFWVAARQGAATVLITVLPADDVVAVPLR